MRRTGRDRQSREESSEQTGGAESTLRLAFGADRKAVTGKRKGESFLELPNAWVAEHFCFRQIDAGIDDGETFSGDNAQEFRY